MNALPTMFKQGDRVRFTTDAKAAKFDAGSGIYEVTKVTPRKFFGDLVEFNGWVLPMCSSHWLELATKTTASS